jgi:hypothetical protein
MENKSETTMSLKEKLVGGILVGSLLGLIGIGICKMAEDCKDSKERVAYCRYEPNSIDDDLRKRSFGSGYYLQGFSRNGDGIDEIKLKYTALFGGKMAVPCSQTYTAKNPEFESLKKCLLTTK